MPQNGRAKKRRIRIKNTGNPQASGIPSSVEATGFEPAASASRTQRSTKLSHASSTARAIIVSFEGFVNKKMKVFLNLKNLFFHVSDGKSGVWE